MRARVQTMRSEVMELEKIVGDSIAEIGEGVDELSASLEQTMRAIQSQLGGTAPLVAYRTEALRELIAALAACDYAICADGGALHLAAALGKPVVALFGDTPPERWRPWGVRHRVLRPASRDVADLDVDQVVAAFRELRAECAASR